jgi:hypothetical protein
MGTGSEGGGAGFDRHAGLATSEAAVANESTQLPRQRAGDAYRGMISSSHLSFHQLDGLRAMTWISAAASHPRILASEARAPHQEGPMGTHRTGTASPGRRDCSVDRQQRDPYRARSKPPEPTVCPECDAVWLGGRWTWAEVPQAAHSQRCPACQRIADAYPAGEVRLEGAFLEAHRAEIRRLVANVAERKAAEHPMQRLMAVREESGGLVITTTDVHLARGIGEAVHRAYQGSLALDYVPEAAEIRVHWSRN